MGHRCKIIPGWLVLLSKKVLSKSDSSFTCSLTMTLSIGLKSSDPARKASRSAVCREASKNIGRSADPVVRSSQRWPDDQDDRYLLSISFFHFFYPKNLLPPSFVAPASPWLHSCSRNSFCLRVPEDRGASLAANRLVVRLSVA